MSNMVFNPYNDFVGVGSTYDTTYGAFGVTAYQNRESITGGYDVALSTHIAPCVEMGCGAHYYSHGIYNSAYRQAETIINLRDITVDTRGRRVACISLGVIGFYSSCDMGIETFDGEEWFAHYWCPNGKVKIDPNTGAEIIEGICGDSTNKMSSNDVEKVKIRVIPSVTSSKDKVTGIFTWYNDVGAVILEETLTCETSRRAMIFDVDGSGLTYQRFHRFMSLIPRDELGYSPQSDTADNSKLLGGNLTNNKLYLANGSSVTWGTNLMDYIWSVQGWNISNFSPGNNDTFSCTHSNYVY